MKIKNLTTDDAWIRLQKKYGNDLKISESAFRNYADTLDKEGRRGQASLEELALAQKKEMITGNKFSDSLKNFGKTALSIAGNMAINYAISKALDIAAEAWDDYINRQEEALERGDQAVENYQENMKKISDASKLIEDSGERFEALQKGIENGVNVTLTTDEYEEYLSLAKQIADTFPELVAGYDSLGNPIINATTNVENLNEALREQQILLAQETIDSAKDFKDAFDAKVSYTATAKNEESGILQKQKFLEYINSASDEELFDRLKYADGISANLSSSLGDITKAFQDWTAGILGKPVSELFPDQPGQEESDYYYERDKALREILEEAGIEDVSDLEIGTEEWNDALSKISKLKKQYENELNEAFSDTKPFIEALFLGDKNYEELTDTTKNAISQVINALDFDMASKLNFFTEDGSLNTEAIEEWSNGIVEKLNTERVQNALNDLFSLNSKKDDMTFTKYQDEANALINIISSSVPELSKDLLKMTSGYDDAVKDLNGSYQKLVKQFGKDNIDKLNNREIEIGAELVGTEEFKGDFDRLLDEIYLSYNTLDLDAKPLKNAVDVAFESENAGDTYKDMVSKLKTAKELYDKAEIGTDDFKTVAAWLSPTGADDAMNFQENWSKAKRYFTDDMSGVYKFLKDLESKGLAECTKGFDANGNAIEQWIYKIDDLEDVAQQLGIGFEPTMALFGRLEDFGFSNNFVGSVDDGVNRIADKISELAQAEAAYAKLLEPGQYETDAGMTFGNQTAIDAKRAEIQGLKNDIDETTKAMELLVSKSAEDRIAETEGAKAAIETLKAEQQKLLNDSTLDEDTKKSIAAQIQDQIDMWAQEYHIDLDAEVNVDDTEIDKISQKTVDLTVRPQVDSTTMQNAGWDVEDGSTATVFSSAYSNEVGDKTVLVTPILPNGEVLTEEQLEAYANQLLNGEEIDADIHIKTFEGRDSIEQSNNYANALHLVQEAYFSADEEQKKVLKSLRGYTSEQLKSIDLFNDSSSSMENALVNLMNSLGVTKEEASEFIDVLSDMGLIDIHPVPVEVEMDITNAEDVEEFGNYLSNLSFTYDPKIIVDVQNDEQIDNIVTKLSKIPPDTPANLSFNVQNQEQADALSEKIDKFNSEAGGTITYTMNVADVDSDKTVTVKAITEGTDDVLGLRDAIKGIDDKDANINAYVFGKTEVDSLAESIQLMPNEKKIYIKSIYTTSSGITEYADGTAHVLGTAPSIKSVKFNDGYLGTAHAQGDWGIKKDEKALTGELGQEILVRGSRFVTIGDNGPEFVNLKRGDIIFNHRQSKELLSKGYTTGRGKLIGGKSYATGSAYAGAGSGGGTIGIGGSGSKAFSTTSTDKNTAATDKNTDAQKETKDWIERLVDATKREADALEAAIESFEMHENQNKAIDAYVKKSQEYMNDLRSAQNAYASKANAVQLSDSYKKKIRNGTLAIEDITDEDLKEKLELYEKWYITCHVA